MPRPKTFDERTALVSTAKLFWKKGYASTSMDDIGDELGLKKTSIYNAFGDKATLFRKVVDWYVAEVVALGITELEGSTSVSEEFSNLLRHFFVQNDERIVSMGCLLTNNVLDLEHTDRELFTYVQAKLKQIPLAFERYLVEAQDGGLIAKESDPKQLANYMLTIFQGMVVRARWQGPDKDREGLITLALIPIRAAETQQTQKASLKKKAKRG